MKRSKWIIGLAVLAMCMFGLAACGSSSTDEAADSAAQAEPVKVACENGVMLGQTADGVTSFKGVPYAKPPVGDLRWRPPQPAAGWEGVRACDTFAPMSMQPETNTVFSSLTDIALYHSFRISLDDNWREPRSEDSLYLKNMILLQ